MPTSSRPRRTITRTSPSSIAPLQPSLPDAALLALARILGAIATQASTPSVAPAAAASERRAHAN
ncbi:MAG TPA: hypothetical protein VH593_27520 [Ktedonobacteraceae bacterium]